MKIRLLEPECYPTFTGRAKRFKNMTEEEIPELGKYRALFEDNDVFADVDDPNGQWIFLIEDEYEVEYEDT